jgi:glutathione S-transferase
MPNYTALATLLALVFYFYTTFCGGERARKIWRYGTGDRWKSRLRARVSGANEHVGVDADISTIPMALRIYVNDAAAAAIGLVWILGRILYFRGYSEAASKRARGFGVQALAAGILFVGAFAGIIAKLIAVS